MQRVGVSWSDDHGANWSDAIEPAAPLRRDGREGTWRGIGMASLGGSTVVAALCWEDYTRPFIPMFNARTEGIVDLKLYWTVSRDGGETFASPEPVDCGIYRDVPTPITGPPLVLTDGRWAFQFEVNKTYDDLAPWRHVSALTFTPDQGATWRETSDVHTDLSRRIVCWDQRLAVMPNGSLYGLFWTFDRQTDSYLNIHARSSEDGGTTWGPLWDTGVPGQPARAVPLDRDRLLMAYVDRTTAPVIKARISNDSGRSWPAGSELVIHGRTGKTETWEKRSMQDAWAEMSKFSIGLPDAAPLPGGDALVVYYAGADPDHTDIRWCRLRPG